MVLVSRVLEFLGFRACLLEVSGFHGIQAV